MVKLTKYFLLIVLVVPFMAGRIDDSPHGDDFDISCDHCHSSKGWELDLEIYDYDHNTNEFPLSGQHTSINCRLCHPTLVFSEADTDCSSCHTDMHDHTVGPDCARCHTPTSWIVGNITEVHLQSRFPLQGPHYMAQCLDCHPSASQLRFEPLGIECVDCHLQDYNGATNPNHVEGNISTYCIVCHSMTAFSWTGAGFNHAFFPLTQGHAISDCDQCHTGNDYSNISPDCFSCHQDDYDATTNPGHLAVNLSTACIECHTTQPGWKPAKFTIHDGLYFPIYSGRHRDEWNSCTECHTNPSNYSIFTCIDCHEHSKSRTDNQHNEERGYEYNSVACLDCHPDGRAED
jgi:hypothetical protein